MRSQKEANKIEDGTSSNDSYELSFDRLSANTVFVNTMMREYSLSLTPSTMKVKCSSDREIMIKKGVCFSPATRHPPRYPSPATRYPSPATRYPHPLPATRHPLPGTRHPLPVTRGKVLPTGQVEMSNPALRVWYPAIVSG